MYSMSAVVLIFALLAFSLFACLFVINTASLLCMMLFPFLLSSFKEAVASPCGPLHLLTKVQHLLFMCAAVHFPKSAILRFLLVSLNFFYSDSFFLLLLLLCIHFVIFVVVIDVVVSYYLCFLSAHVRTLLLLLFFRILCL
ncbi:hypothetical protein ABB37_07130 [Leptomonas pyrrhocoris]|uniref:Uncharacterized protein n=1 Tax=Leptomonas pyrrhocoris TaxID=157538 RepID=A0A0M9FW61_LEPPY|nr:hypothetical protein ABB37_07130 [Leptomonas pyrrhocoris]KPA77223.1 hypothetical protein ABB37_07130 [Leptomonas pyrrhocoris]|eukprot:XP_015655662.1 hypothetical protein ABB37_07130 [Leptomonas pyrrhocoris]